MKLFIIRNVLTDYSYSGMVAIKAESLSQAREFFVERFGDRYEFSEFEKEFDDAIKNKDYDVLNLADIDSTAVGFVKVMTFGGS